MINEFNCIFAVFNSKPKHAYYVLLKHFTLTPASFFVRNQNKDELAEGPHANEKQ
jgi:hypothetical protein